jgi:acylphosphatase
MRSACHCLVSGRVHGVFYRASCRDEALARGLTGWVRNLPDGRVEVAACGDPHQLKAFRGWLRQGPPGARVDEVRCEVRAAEEFSSFVIR